ncbi:MULTISPECIES: DUF4124 domain-containing protein [unclassified Undibacterium]|uniref:DUF4124 domain-containing protein n=1 Tax=unclassified Undibacterium TaxID=2630295 RepID=UPI002AC90D39|nr:MULTISPECIES: DUF4124 domain-containing protein [unclassified Undibacterium]MEB0138968.1 hypothetical protein [Undibacterium sp. CCC2.1]MEB0171937.1 hypothetical protein [Undibacterium sp. CCC1.1]MEB0175878.1 hypothetical protein [Undibacterium sp. CCC3.4]MEB0215056.1 hypothetical protein [Undibacterium sp. 5I2]WPX45028.1 hypothetical protein RHM61_07335 [Undibacterium sp. CCC3.4]
MKSFFLLVLLLSGVAHADTPVFKCTVNGSVVWSDSPCAGNGKVVKVKNLPATPRKPGATPSVPAR